MLMNKYEIIVTPCRFRDAGRVENRWRRGDEDANIQGRAYGIDGDGNDILEHIIVRHDVLFPKKWTNNWDYKRQISGKPRTCAWSKRFFYEMNVVPTNVRMRC